MREFDVAPELADAERAETEEERVARRNAQVLGMIDGAMGM